MPFKPTTPYTPAWMRLTSWSKQGIMGSFLNDWWCKTSGTKPFVRKLKLECQDLNGTPC